MQRKGLRDTPVRSKCDIPGKCRYTLLNHHVFEVDEKYVPIKAIGKGAYGLVCSAENRETREKVAIKKISGAFCNDVDAIRTLREINLLRHIEHDNVIAIRDILSPATEKFEDVYIVYDCMDTDLHQIIRSSQPLSDDHFQFFIWQLLRGLKYLHSANIIHRDLKPGNLLLNADCDLKICDFGLARANTKRVDMTKYVVTRWYRAPELLLSCHYTTAIDMWSVGCILAEMLQRTPLFQGVHYIQQLENIVRTLGHPSKEELSFVTHPKARAFLRNVKVPEDQKKFKERFPKANPKAVDLLEKLLQFDPRKRLSAAEALAHPWLASLHEEDKEPSTSTQFNFDFEEDNLTPEDIRNLVLKEIQMLKARNAARDAAKARPTSSGVRK